MASDKRHVLLVQLPIPPPGPGPIRGNVPLAAGYLKLLARNRGLEAALRDRDLPAALANRLGDEGLVAAILARDPGSSASPATCGTSSARSGSPAG